MADFLPPRGSSSRVYEAVMLVGYARVSTDDQNLDMQRQALRQAGCEIIFEDHGLSGADTARPGLAQAMDSLAAGDILVVWKLDRLGRSLGHLVELLKTVEESGAGFQSMSEAINTETAGGRLIFHVLAAIAEFERSLISERTRAGMAAARKRGTHLGRPWLLTDGQAKEARMRIEDGESIENAARLYGASRETLVRAIGRLGEGPRRI